MVASAGGQQRLPLLYPGVPSVLIGIFLDCWDHHPVLSCDHSCVWQEHMISGFALRLFYPACMGHLSCGCLNKPIRD